MEISNENRHFVVRQALRTMGLEFEDCGRVLCVEENFSLHLPDDMEVVQILFYEIVDLASAADAAIRFSRIMDIVGIDITIVPTPTYTESDSTSMIDYELEN